MTEAAGIYDGSEPWENTVGAQEAGDDRQRLLPLLTPVLLLSLAGIGDKWGGGGEGHGLGLHVVPICPISTRETAAAYTRPLGCDLNSKFFLYKFM